MGAARRVVPASATGGGHYTAHAELRTLAFSAVRHADGPVQVRGG